MKHLQEKIILISLKELDRHGIVNNMNITINRRHTKLLLQSKQDSYLILKLMTLRYIQEH